MGSMRKADLLESRLTALAHPARVAMVRLLAELPDEHPPGTPGVAPPSASASAT
jgi:ArsR family transcriptional regulator